MVKNAHKKQEIAGAIFFYSPPKICRLWGEWERPNIAGLYHKTRLFTIGY